jgi:hypothetical protein
LIAGTLVYQKAAKLKPEVPIAAAPVADNQPPQTQLPPPSAFSASFLNSCRDIQQQLSQEQSDPAKLAKWFQKFLELDQANKDLYQADNRGGESDLGLLRANLKAKMSSCHFLRKSLLGVSVQDQQTTQAVVRYLKRSSRAPGLMSLKVDLEILNALTKNKVLKLGSAQNNLAKKQLERASADIQSMVARMSEIGPPYQEFLKALSENKSEAEAPILQSAELKAQAQKFILNEREAQAEYFKLVDSL